MDILVTNNPLVAAQCKSTYQVDYIDTDIIGLLTKVRDLIHKGHRLLTHPLTGSVKPNETPYKSIILSEVSGKTDLQSVTIIEDSIAAAQKFSPRNIPEKYLQDMQMVDLSLITSSKKPT